MNRFDNDYMHKFDEALKFFKDSKVRILASILVWFFSMTICFFFSNEFIRLLETRMPFDVELLQLYVHEVFLNNLKIGLFLGTFLSMPFLIYQFSKLKIKNINSEQKQKLVKITSYVFGTAVLALLVSYYMLIPMQLFILMGMNTELSSLTLAFSSYVSFCISTIFVTCLIFLLPLINYLLKKNQFFSHKDIIGLKKPMLYLSMGLAFLILSPPEVLAFALLTVLIYSFYLATLFIVEKKVFNNLCHTNQALLP